MVITDTNNTYTILSTIIEDILDKKTISTLVEDYVSTVLSRSEFNFEGGVLGLGWLIAFLLNRDFLVGEEDEILEDFDDQIYKLTIKEVLSAQPNVDTLLDFMSYYQLRINPKSITAPYYRRFTHFECIKLIIQRLNQYLTEEKGDDVEAKLNIVLRYSYLSGTTVSESLFENEFYKTVEEILDFIEKEDTAQIPHSDLSKLYVCVHQYNNDFWKNKIRRKLKDIPYSYTSKIWNSVIADWKDNYISIPHSGLFLDNNERGKFLVYLFSNFKNVQITYANN